MSQRGFTVVDVSDWEVDADEPAGQDEKQWLIEPTTGEKWLFKPPVEKNGFRQGEDWSEKVSAQLAQLLSVPCAEVELAERHSRRGSISRNLRPEGWEMQSGSLLLSATIPGYQPGSLNVKGRPGHSLENIADVLSDAAAPLGAYVPESFGAFSVFAGYLVLDAWIANRDRHDENWSILLPLPPHDADERYRLCGSYDQAGGLGYNVHEEAAKRRLAEPDGVRHWVEKGTAYRFEHDPGQPAPTLVELGNRALAIAGQEARAYWTSKLAAVTSAQVEDLVSSVPELSEPCRNFAREVLTINQERMLDVCG